MSQPLSQAYTLLINSGICNCLTLISPSSLTFIEISDIKKTFRRNSFLIINGIIISSSIVIIIITDGKYFLLVETFNEIYCGGHHHYNNDDGCPNHSCESPYNKICSNHRCGCFRKYVIQYQVFSLCL